MQLKTPLPLGRSLDQLRHHFFVEKAIADRLRAASREERTALYAHMYADLFTQVPDHPRLTQREDEALTRQAVVSKLRIVGRFLRPATVFLEFGAGDCRFAAEVCRRVQRVIAVDISDQSGQVADRPDNFQLIVYDGDNLALGDEIADTVFSDQLIEHLHPEDTRLHFELVRRLLQPGGQYVFRTPHAFTGPHDISMYFSDAPEGFHLKEWTYTELDGLLGELGFRRMYALWRPYGLWRFKAAYRPLPIAYCRAVERCLASFRQPIRKRLARWLLRELCLVAVK
jgi:SAM-dependent methyltransferase